MSKTPPSQYQPINETDLNDYNYAVIDDENIVMQERNFQGVLNIWSNPPNWPTPQYKYPASGAQVITPIRTPLVQGSPPLETDYNNFAGDGKSLGQRVQVSVIAQPTGYATIPTPISGQPVITQATHIQTAYNVLNNIITILNAYDGWWNVSNYCKRSCQIACQVGCQVSCQGCNHHTCHDQRCGTH